MRALEFFCHPFSIQGRDQRRLSIPKKQERVIWLVSLIAGALTGGLAFPFLFYGLSYKYRVELLKSLSPSQQEAKKLGQRILTPTNPTLPEIDREDNKKQNIKAEEMHDLLHISSEVSQRGVCSREAGATCYINTVFQVLAHIPEQRKYFDKSHLLRLSADETEKHFDLRKKLQRSCNSIIEQILKGASTVTGIKELLAITNELVPPVIYIDADEETGKKAERSETLFSPHGGDQNNALKKLLELVEGENVYPISSLHAPSTHNDLDEHGFPKWISLCNYHSTLPATHVPLSFQSNGRTYDLEIVTTSGGHANATIRDSEGSFYLLDDLNASPKKIPEISGDMHLPSWWDAYYKKRIVESDEMYDLTNSGSKIAKKISHLLMENKTEAYGVEISLLQSKDFFDDLKQEGYPEWIDLFRASGDSASELPLSFSVNDQTYDLELANTFGDLSYALLKESGVAIYRIESSIAEKVPREGERLNLPKWRQAYYRKRDLGTITG